MTRSQGPLDALTEREHEILTLLAQGRSDREIAQQLILTVGTVKWYNRQLYSKLGVNNRTLAVTEAQRLGLLNRPSSSSQSELPTTNLPVPMSSFVGRTHELAEAQRLLESTRLLTMTGPPGSGKTRLAIKLAHDTSSDYRDGVWFVPLASLEDSGLVLSSIAHVFKVTAENSRTLLSALIDHLRTKQLLLILDNFEHVLTVSAVVSDLLGKAPELKVLVTSREILHIYGEQEYPVNPLTLPSPGQSDAFDTLHANEAVQLFVSRAQAVAPNFELTPNNAGDVAAICIKLDGLPLAIELAASRIKLFSPQTLVIQLQDRFGTLVDGAHDLPPRMRTLHNALDWSWHLLSTDEQIFFCRLGVFAGSFTLETADAVCHSNLRIGCVDLLRSLVDKSLLYRTNDHESRFAMLETVREFALQQLDLSGDAHHSREVHARYYFDIVQQVNHKRRDGGSGFLQLVEPFEYEHDNLRAAQNWLLMTHDTERALLMTGGLAEFWWMYGHAVEGSRWAERALTTVPMAPSISRGLALRTLGLLLYERGHFSRAMVVCQEAAEIFRAHDCTFELAWMLAYLGTIAGEMNDERAGAFLTQALDLFRSETSPLGMAFTLNHLGEVMRHIGDYERALDYYEQSLVYRQELYGWAGNPTRTYVNLGFTLHVLAQPHRARQAFEQGLKNSLETKRGAKWIVEPLIGLAVAFTEDNDLARAVQLLGAIDAICESLEPTLMYQKEFENIIGELRITVDPGLFRQAWTQGRSMSLDAAVAFALETVGENDGHGDGNETED